MFRLGKGGASGRRTADTFHEQKSAVFQNLLYPAPGGTSSPRTCLYVDDFSHGCVGNVFTREGVRYLVVRGAMCVEYAGRWCTQYAENEVGVLGGTRVETLLSKGRERG